MRLANVDREIKVREEMSKPQSYEEAEALERMLSEALDELKEIKSELRKKRASEPTAPLLHAIPCLCDEPFGRFLRQLTSTQGESVRRMNQQSFKPILGCRIRANSDIEIVAFDELLSFERAALGITDPDPDYYGIIYRKGARGQNVKAICTKTADLLQHLQGKEEFPDTFFVEQSGETNAEIAELVLDGILEICHRGRFVSGVDARDAVYQPTDAIENFGTISRLSIEALKHGQSLPIDVPEQLSAQMYFYNRVPISPKWMALLGSEEQVAAHLGIAGGGASAGLLDNHWTLSSRTPERAGWLAWWRKRHVRNQNKSSAIFKLYVSPALNAVASAFAGIVEVFTEEGVPQFKVGADLLGLARPDKIVAYFDSFEHVEHVARRLEERLGEVKVQGVPFTADLGGDGLLSWGIDPREKPVLDQEIPFSWRLWITHHLAKSLIVARQSPRADVEPWRFALERLNFEGVETDTWTPTLAFECRAIQ